jgi:hypothetical protein
MLLMLHKLTKIRIPKVFSGLSPVIEARDDHKTESEKSNWS